MTTPNTELKSAEEWIKERPKNNCSDENECAVDCEMAFLEREQEWIRSIQHNAMLHAAEIVVNTSTDDYGNLSYCKQAILTRAEQILKGEK